MTVAFPGLISQISSVVRHAAQALASAPTTFCHASAGSFIASLVDWASCLMAFPMGPDAWATHRLITTTVCMMPGMRFELHLSTEPTCYHTQVPTRAATILRALPTSSSTPTTPSTCSSMG